MSRDTTPTRCAPSRDSRGTKVPANRRSGPTDRRVRTRVGRRATDTPLECAYCGLLLLNKIPHASGAGCIEALRAEVEALRDRLSRTESALQKRQ